MRERELEPVKVAYSYAHEDEALKNEIVKCIKTIPGIKQWHDRNILPSANWEKEIIDHLLDADIIFLLISFDFLNSDYCIRKEMQIALERHVEGNVCVIPIVLHPAPLQDQPFSHLQMLPTDATPIDSWRNPHEALLNIRKEVQKVVERKREREQFIDIAERYCEQGEHEEADKAYHTALEYLEDNEPFMDKLSVQKSRADLWCRIGDARRKSGQQSAALDAYKQALLFDASNVQTHVIIAQLYGEASQQLKAIGAYHQAIQLAPDKIELYIQEYILLSRQRQYNEALKTCDQAIAKFPGNAEIMRHRGQILYSAQRYEESYRAFEAAQKLDPDNLYLSKNLGDALFELKRFREATNIYENILEALNQRGKRDDTFWSQVVQKRREAVEKRSQQLER